MKLLLSYLVWGMLIFFLSCKNGNSGDRNLISADSASIASGEKAFNQHCSGCHNFSQDGIGPQLSGITTKVSADWILHFIKNPQQVISSGGERGRQLFKKYKTLMPSFSTLKETDLNAIIAFLNVHRTSVRSSEKEMGNAIANPIPERIPLSNLVIHLRLLTQFPPSVDSGKHPAARITKLDFEPGTGDLFVLDLRGKLYKLQKNNKPVVWMDMAELRPAFINEPGLATGFGSFAFHPDYARNGIFYTTHTEKAGSANADFRYPDSIKVAMQWVLTEWKAKDPGASKFSGTSRELLRINMVSGSHGMQEIVFNPLAKPGDKDYGLLYIGIGDGGAVDNGYPSFAHNLKTIWGTILRIDPGGRNSVNGHYGIPPDNPFVNNPGKIPGEIYAYGFRNPHRISWTRSGAMLACNIGQTNIESVNLIRPGHDYGWPVREGNFLLDPNGDLDKVYPLPANDSTFKITYPIAEFDHDEGNAISGGFEYQGNKIPRLKGKYLFGDIPSGRLFFIKTADIKQGKQAPVEEWKISLNGIPETFREIIGTGRVDIHFGRDSQGELYILTKSDGKLYKLMQAE